MRWGLLAIFLLAVVVVYLAAFDLNFKELWFYPYITLVTTILLSLIIHTLSGKILKGLSIK